MQPFRLRLDARKWFRDLRDQNMFEIDFDAFYFCFVTGIVTGTKVAVPTMETAELVDNFPEKYKSRGKLLVGLFLKSELDLLGISMMDRRAVRTTIGRFVSPESPSFLSGEGINEFNRYAHGGYERLIEWFESRPHSLETFLRDFKRRMDDVTSESVD